MSIEAVVGHDASQIWVSNEEDAKQIVHLSLIPIRSVLEIANAGDRSCLVGICLDSYAGVVPDAEHVVHDLESLVFGGVVDSCDIRHLGELGCSVIFEPGEDWDDAGRGDMDGQFVLPDGESACY